MKKIVLFDPTIGTTNLGDYIIMLSVEKYLKKILGNEFFVKVPTRTPLMHLYQKNKKNILYRTIINADLKIICGTNLLYTNLLRPWPLLNINIFDTDLYKGAILMGVGCGINSKTINVYTQYIYKNILNKDIFHSVRDEYTKNFIESLGFKAINTGCPTLWGLDNSICESIPKTKSDKVVFTLTDYSKDIQNDSMLIQKLKDNYKQIYFWPQGIEDFHYLKTIVNNDLSDINIISSTLQDFDNYLKEGNTDYIGTRLHAGIFALQHKIRTIILSVDYRASSMNYSNALPIFDRKKVKHLDSIINSSIIISNVVKKENIEKWLQQFS